MERLVGKNILIIIPKDYYMESEFDPILESMNSEGANVLVASNKLKDAVGMKGGKTTPDVLIVDAIEGITGDSYVSAGKGVHHTNMVIAGIGSAVPSMGKAGLLQSLEVTTEPGNKKAIAALEESKAVLVDEPMTFTNRIFTVRDANAIPAFLDPFIEEVAKTPTK
jgi:protease I